MNWNLLIGGDLSLPMVLACLWSAALLFAIVTATKYRHRRPPILPMGLFVVAGINAAFAALFFNNTLHRETTFMAFSDDRLESLLGFLVGAGMGEELFKLGGGLLALLALLAVNKEIGPGGRFLGLVVVALTFAVAENWIAYRWQETGVLLSRGLLAVPLHATMGMFHGECVNRAWRRASPIPLFQGYALTVALHTLYDLGASVLTGRTQVIALFSLVLVLLVAGFYEWHRTPEAEPAPMPSPTDEPAA